MFVDFIPNLLIDSRPSRVIQAAFAQEKSVLGMDVGLCLSSIIFGVFFCLDAEAFYERKKFIKCAKSASLGAALIGLGSFGVWLLKNQAVDIYCNPNEYGRKFGGQNDLWCQK